MASPKPSKYLLNSGGKGFPAKALLVSKKKADPAKKGQRRSSATSKCSPLIMPAWRMPMVTTAGKSTVPASTTSKVIIQNREGNTAG
jgi:hypothetical protein